MYYVYMLRCKDNSIYTGITTDLERRMKEHFQKTDKCAKYTLVHEAYKLERAWEATNKVQASKLEYHIKKSLNKKQKEEIIKNPNNIYKYLSDKINQEEFKIKY